VQAPRALYDYIANPADPNELSFKKGDIFDITDRSLGTWRDVEAADGSTGIICSKYVQLVR
jgi:SHO1 osmosensor